MTSKVTIHSLVRNEERWVWFALTAWQKAPVDFLVVDNESSDQTPQILKATKIPYQTWPGEDITILRNRMLKETKTDWFVLVDGDEVWDDGQIAKFLAHLDAVSPRVTGVFLSTRNCVGDVWHYLATDSGRYQLAGVSGHLNIRAYRRRKGYQWFGQYPLEYYGRQDQSINNDPSQLSHFSGYYWHLTHLSRTAVSGTPGFRRRVLESGITVAKSQLPEVFFLPCPPQVPDPLVHRSFLWEIAATMVTPVKKLRRALL